MKGFLKFLVLATVVGAVIFFVLRRFRQDSVFDPAPVSGSAGGNSNLNSGQRRSISRSCSKYWPTRPTRGQ